MAVSLAPAENDVVYRSGVGEMVSSLSGLPSKGASTVSMSADSV
jgi:hypothetical protein